MTYAVTARRRRAIKTAKSVAEQAADPFGFRWSNTDQQDVFSDDYARSMSYEQGQKFGLISYFENSGLLSPP